MNAQQQTELREKLGALAARDRKELIRQASALRSKAQANSAKESRRPVEWFLLNLLLAPAQEVPNGIVIGVDRTRCVARINGLDVSCRCLEGLAPGDAVLVVDDAVTQVAERRTVLERKEGARTRVIAANIDLVMVVVSVVSPPLHPRLIDRYLAAIRLGGAEAAICLNKADLGVSGTDQSAIDAYRDLAPLFVASAETGDGIEQLRTFISGKLSALVGHSGVGKSTLLNAIVGNEVAKGGAVSHGTGKGAHTTTRSTLHEVNGIRMLDTPGIREFAVAFESPQDVVDGFVEIARVGSRCKYAGCHHLDDTGCAVIEAVRRKEITEERYDSYVKLLLDSFPKL